MYEAGSVVKLEAHILLLQLYMGTRDLNSALYTFPANTSSTERLWSPDGITLTEILVSYFIFVITYFQNT